MNLARRSRRATWAMTSGRMYFSAVDMRCGAAAAGRRGEIAESERRLRELRGEVQQVYGEFEETLRHLAHARIDAEAVREAFRESEQILRQAREERERTRRELEEAREALRGARREPVP